MKRLLFSTVLALGAAVLLGTAGARADGPAAPLPQGPATGGAPTAAAAPAAPAQLASPYGAAVVVAPPPAALVPAACCDAPACCEAPALKKVCVGEQAVRTIDKRVYGETCEDFCVPKCSLFGGFKLGGHKHDDCGSCGGCDEGGCTSCEHHARTRKYLVVKIRHEEECYNKCHVEYQAEEAKCQKGACCADGCCPPSGGCAGMVTLPPAAAPMPPVAAPMPRAENLAPPKQK